MDPGRRRLAERRLLSALRRLHRREPMRTDFRTDAVLRELRADPAESRPAGHRGAGSLASARDADLLAVLDGLVSAGDVMRTGRRLRLPAHEADIADPQMRARVERLLADLRAGGAAPPRVEALARRLGVPPPVIDGLRANGQLVALADGIDYPRDRLTVLLRQIDTIATDRPLTVGRVRDAFGTSRRHAQALVAYRERSETRRGAER